MRVDAERDTSTVIILAQAIYIYSDDMSFTFSQATIVHAPDGSQWVLTHVVQLDDVKYAPIGKRGRSTKAFLRFMKAGRNYCALSNLIQELHAHRATALEKALKAENPFQRDASAGAVQSIYAAKANKKRLKLITKSKVPVVMLPAFYNKQNELVESRETLMPCLLEHCSNAHRGGLLLQLDGPTLQWVKERFSVIYDHADQWVYKGKHKAPKPSKQTNAAAGVVTRYADHESDVDPDGESDGASASSEDITIDRKSIDARPSCSSANVDDAEPLSGNAGSSPPGVDAEADLENAGSSSQSVHVEASLNITSFSSDPAPTTHVATKYFPMFVKSVKSPCGV